ncbi:uncharacterized protein V1510DRAFT_404160 [Dipodascopsis tothii]|uniref:uncharacterized protein n=1 Tax=Dipodascopsis tothii TaxID=44089 RepID=UPI0034CDC6A5
MAAKRSVKKPAWTEPVPAVPIPGPGGFAVGVPPPSKYGRARKMRPSIPGKPASPAPGRRFGGERGRGRGGRGRGRGGVARRGGHAAAGRRAVTNPVVLAPPTSEDDGEAAEAAAGPAEADGDSGDGGSDGADGADGADEPTDADADGSVSRSASPPADDGPERAREELVRRKYRQSFDVVVGASGERSTAGLATPEASPRAASLRGRSPYKTIELQPEKKENKRKDRLATPPPAGGAGGSAAERQRRQKRVKISPIKSRRENVFGFALPPEAAGPRAGTVAADDPTKFNDDFCSACGGIGRFLCCESCPRSFHFTCTDPPVDEDNLPEDSWFCTSCYHKQLPAPKPTRGLFAQLLEQMDRRNPVCFGLPKALRERYEGVSTGELGEYQDIHDLKQRKLSRSGFVEELDPHRLQDKNGNTILCFYCGKSALDDRSIVTCDYCTLSYHMDCLDPPMYVMPTAQKKWMCPNHVDKDLTHHRRKKNSKIVDVSLRRGFVNNGDIEVDTESSDDDVAGLVKPSHLHFIDGWEDAPLDIYGRRGPDVEFEEFDMDGVVYRLPERGIVLDFCDKINMTVPDRRYAEPPPALSDLDRLVVRPYDERELVRNLAYLQTWPSAETQVRQRVSTLLDAALGRGGLGTAAAAAAAAAADATAGPGPVKAEKADDAVPATPRSPPSSAANTASTSPTTPTTTGTSGTAATATTSAAESLKDAGDDATADATADRAAMAAIQKLIRIKGKDALMQFLLA